jgi:leader peptidase (prepilin peptidase)/N-methyltransferase
MVIILAFLAGLLIGSFLNVCVYRLPRDLSVVRPARSFCPACEKTIAWYDNIPIVSYIILRARCRHCGEHIPIRYVLVELATGAAFAICAAYLGSTPLAVKFAIFAAIQITLIASDFEELILPDEFTLGGAAVGIIFATFVPMEPGYAHVFLGLYVGPMWLSIGEALLGAFVCSGIAWLVGWLFEKIRHKEGLGLGDVKMIGMIGAFLGLEGALLTWILASVIGAIGGLIFIWAARKKAATYELPFGSFLGLAALAVAAYMRYQIIHLGLGVLP